MIVLFFDVVLKTTTTTTDALSLRGYDLPFAAQALRGLLSSMMW